MPKYTQRRSLKLIPARLRAERTALREAFMRTVAALPKRPEPSDPWDCRGRGSNKADHPAIKAVALCRAAYRDAVATKDTDTMRLTRLAIEAYWAECCEASLDVGAVVELAPAVSDVVREECEAVSAIVAANETKSPGALDYAKQQVREALDSGAAFLRGLNARTRQAAAEAR
jgi:hypothetical protein